MGTRKRLTAKSFIIANIVFALIFLNTLLFGGRLRAGESFTAGFLTGFGLAWLAFFVFGRLEIRKPGSMMDERQAAHFSKATGIAFWVAIMVACVLQVLLRAEALGIVLEARDAVAIPASLGLAALGVSWAVIARTR